MPYASQSGRSSMVERELPKLYTRVRFPSPAPDKYLLNPQIYSHFFCTAHSTQGFNAYVGRLLSAGDSGNDFIIQPAAQRCPVWNACIP